MHAEELYNLYSLSAIIRMTKSRMVRWAGHLECMENEKGIQNVREPEVKRHLGIYGRILLQ
jgi:hypothetical protein